MTGKIKERANSSNVYIESCGKVSIVSTRGTKRKKRRPKRKKQKRCGQVLWMIMINIVKEDHAKVTKVTKGARTKLIPTKTKAQTKSRVFQARDKI